MTAKGEAERANKSREVLIRANPNLGAELEPK
jgi:hypothetical protein